MKVKINIDSVDKILKKRKLNKNGPAQVFLTNEIARHANPYVPFRNGGLKDKQVRILPNQIQYNAPYAKSQYYDNAGFGKEGISRGGLRGKQWIPRMMSARRVEIVKSVADFVGGKAK